LKYFTYASYARFIVENGRSVIKIKLYGSGNVKDVTLSFYDKGATLIDKNGIVKGFKFNDGTVFDFSGNDMIPIVINGEFYGYFNPNDMYDMSIKMAI
jgi:hypothetical protein